MRALARHWLGPQERFADLAELTARVLVRSLRWAPGTPPLPLLYDTVRGTPGFDALRRHVVGAQTMNVELDRRGYPGDRVSATAVRRYCLGRWNVAALVPTGYDRGFVTLDDLERRVRPLVAYAGSVSRHRYDCSTRDGCRRPRGTEYGLYK